MSKNRLLIQKCNTIYNSNNYIPELLMAYSVIDGEFLLEWCEYFGQPPVWYISYIAHEPLI